MRCASLFVTAAMLAPLPAQEALKYGGPSPGTVKLGDDSQIQLVVEGESADPRTPELPEVPFLIMQVSAPARHHSSFFDGRTMTVRNEVRFTVTLRPQRAGTFDIPPIRVFTGSGWQQTPNLRLDCVKDMRGQDLGYLEVKVEPQRVYVHEPIRITVDLGIDAGLKLVQDVYQRSRYLDVEVQAPWLSKLDGAVTMPSSKPDNLRLLVLNRTLLDTDYTPQHQRDGKTYNRFVFDRAFLPTKVGRFELPAPLLRYNVLEREGRVGPFFEQVGRKTENYYVYGKPVSLEVLPIPEEGRPVPYFGAVGRFAVGADLDRNEVEVGSSVKLKFLVRGRGNLEFLRVPELEELSGFHKLGQTEERDQNSVRVTYDLTPLDAAVREVPSIEWNYFDTTPGVEQFVTVETEPLPLTVKPLENGETLAPLAGADDRAVVPGVDDIFDLKPLDIGAEQVLGVKPGGVGSLLAALAPWFLAIVGGLSWTRWRRRAGDLIGQRARRAERRFRAALAGDADPAEALAGYLGDRLGVPAAAMIGPDLRERLLAAGIDEPLAEDLCTAVEGGVAARYGGGVGLSSERAAELVAAVERLPLPRVGGAVALLLCVVALFADRASAQHGDAAQRGMRAYRQGEYADAATAFREAVRGSDVDRRLYYNLGNALFRQGEWAEALWAYERARLAMPRDPELGANIALTRSRLSLNDESDEPFLDALRELRDSLSGGEQIGLSVLLHMLAAGLLVLGRRKPGLRWLAAAVAVPALLLTLELCWWAPRRPPSGVMLQAADVVAEPREGLEPVLKVKPGVELAVLGSGEQWTMVELRGRRGYVPSDRVGVVH